jgi:hypothetical protein
MMIFNIVAWIVAIAVALFAALNAILDWMANNGHNPFM